VRLLLDTHVVLWWLADDRTLSDDIKASLDHEPDVYISSATIWEVTIKQALGKLPKLPDLPERIRDSGFRKLIQSSAKVWLASTVEVLVDSQPHRPVHRECSDRVGAEPSNL
jgi:PIN domain nuclease of toxin-antitoxin system